MPMLTLLAAAVALATPPGHEGPQPPSAPATPAPASAATHSHHRPDCGCRYGGDHREHSRNLIGAKFYNVNIFQAGERDEAGDEVTGERSFAVYSLLGAGVFYEREVVPDWLELELNVLVLTDRRATVVPFEFFFKKSWHASRRATPYIGVGPTLDLLFEAGRAHPFFGLSATAGSYVWISRSFGIDLDIGYSAVFERHVAHELNLGVGPVFQF